MKLRIILRCTRRVLLLAGASLAGNSFADAVVSPIYADPGSTPYPFYVPSTSMQSVRYQQVYGAADFLGIGSPMVVTGLLFNAQDYVLTHPLAQFDVNLPNVAISLSTTLAAGDSLSPVFANNVGTDATVVFSGALHLYRDPEYDLRFVYISFSTPFYYDPSSGNLLMDIRNFQTLPPGFAYGQLSRSTNTYDQSSRIMASDANATTATVVDTLALDTVFGVRPVPEPSVGVLLLAGVGVLIACRRPLRFTGTRRTSGP